MIALDLAKFIGICLGIGSGVLIYIFWTGLKSKGLEQWKSRRSLMLLAGIGLLCLLSFLTEFNRAPITKRLSYRVAKPQAERLENPEPTVTRIRMSQEGSMGGFLNQPVYQRQLLAASLVIMALVFINNPGIRHRLGLKIVLEAPVKHKSLNIDKGEALASLENVLTKEKRYADPDLNLDMLALELNMSKYHLSQLINEELGQNFYALINSRRVAAAIDLMQQSESAELTLSAVGFEVGFNSKSSFYRAFKQRTGLTPAAYRKSLR